MNKLRKNWSKLTKKPSVHLHKMKVVYEDEIEKIWRNVTVDYVTFYRCYRNKSWWMAIEKAEHNG